MAKKARTQLTGLGPDRQNLSNPSALFGLMERNRVAVPDYAVAAMVQSRPERGTLTVAFYEDMREFFRHYTKTIVMRRRPDAVYNCFARDPGCVAWTKMSPPALIGPDIETRLR